MVSTAWRLPLLRARIGRFVTAKECRGGGQREEKKRERIKEDAKQRLKNKGKGKIKRENAKSFLNAFLKKAVREDDDK